MTGADASVVAKERSAEERWSEGSRTGGYWGLSSASPASGILPGALPTEGDVPSEQPHEPGYHTQSLLGLIDALGPLPRLTAAAGLDEAGSPVLLPLRSRQVWNLLILGQASSGKSEWLRALVMSLALTSAPDQLQIVGIDLGGRELAVLDSLPHTVAGLATRLDTACELLAWINAEMDRRPRDAVSGADMALVVDDLRWASHAGDGPAAALLGRLSARGWQSGIHILAAGTVEPFAVGGQAARGLAVPGRLGWFDLVAGRERARVRACGLSAWELDQAVRRLTSVGRRELR